MILTMKTNDPPILVVAKSIDISPPYATRLFGYIGRNETFTGLEGTLEANLLLFKQGQRNIALFSIDTLFVGDFEQDLKNRMSVSSAHLEIIAVASHSHYAPCIDASKPKIGQIDSGYYDFVLEKVSAELLSAIEQDGAITRIEKTQITSNNLAINRRAKRYGLQRRFPFVRRYTAIAPNFKASRDFPLRFIKIQSGEDTTAILWNWTCHPVSAAEPLKASSSYIGAVREQIRKTFKNPNLPVVFLQGFSGDIRPMLGLKKPTLKGRLVSFPGLVFSEPSQEQYSRWCNAIAQLAKKAVSKDGECENLNGAVEYSETSMPLDRLLAELDSTKRLTVARLKLGDTADFVFMSAEVVRDYEKLVKKQFSPETICIGYRGNCFGYLPTDAQVKEGGYEAKEFIAPFSLSGSFKAGLEKIIQQALSELI